MSDEFEFEQELRAARPHTEGDDGWTASPAGDAALAAIHRRMAGRTRRLSLSRPSRRAAVLGLGLTAAAAVAVTLAITVPDGTGRGGTPPIALPPSTAQPGSPAIGPRPTDLELTAYDSCAAALAGLREHAAQHVTAYGLGNGYDYKGVVPASTDGLRSATPNEAAPAHSTTNDQEAGVDEPDTVETDGNRVVSVSGGVLRVVDTATRKITGTLDLTMYAGADQAQLLMSGNRVLVILGASTPVYRGPMAIDYYGESAADTGYLLVDIAQAPKIVGTLHPRGYFVDARLVDGTVRLVVDNAPDLRLPVLSGRNTAKQQRAADRAAVKHAPLSAWQPSYQVTTGGTTTSKQVPCTDISHPAKYTGASLLTVYSVDLAAGLDQLNPISLAADGATVYASPSSLYVASGTDRRTHVHRFDISRPGKPAYLGSGSIPGYLLDAYSLSEYDGYLRAVTTANVYSQHASSSVYVLDADTLRVVGHVDGLGVGEQVQAVRFLGPLAYLVTYQQVDPLFIIDLADPKHPKAAGRLEVTGYSDYLYPTQPGRLLGIGQDVSAAQLVRGLQVSLFDVTHAAHPKRIADVIRKHTPGEDRIDPHAFLYWPATGTAVVPIDSWNWTQSGAVLVLHVTGDGLRTVGLIRNPEVVTADDTYQDGIERSLWIGGSIWTMSASGLQVSDGATLHRQAWIPF